MEKNILSKLTPELSIKVMAFAFALGGLWMKLDTIDQRVTRIENKIDSGVTLVSVFDSAGSTLALRQTP